MKINLIIAKPFILLIILLISLSACKSTIKNEELSWVEQETKTAYEKCKRKQDFKSYNGAIRIDTLENKLLLFYDSMYVRINQNAPKNIDLFFNGIINREVLQGVSSMDTIFLQSIEDVSYIIMHKKNNTRYFKISYWGTKFTHNSLYIFISIKSKGSTRKSDWEFFIKNAKLTFASNVFVMI